MRRPDIFLGIFVEAVIIPDDLVKIIDYSFLLVLCHEIEIQLNSSCIFSSFDLHVC